MTWRCAKCHNTITPADLDATSGLCPICRTPRPRLTHEGSPGEPGYILMPDGKVFSCLSGGGWSCQLFRLVSGREPSIAFWNRETRKEVILSIKELVSLGTQWNETLAGVLTKRKSVL
jgi:hypothetical protein